MKSFDDNEIEKVTGDEDGPNPSSIRAELPLSIDRINEIWNEPFDHICPGSHSEERFFADGDNGGNRVVYLQEFLKKVLPGVYWKIRATGLPAVFSGKDSGLFEEHEEMTMLGWYKNTGVV